MSGFQGYDQWKTASPFDDIEPCEVCGKDESVCECPECPECGTHGDPDNDPGVAVDAAEYLMVPDR